MNNISLIGNLTRDPEVRYTQLGKAVAGFTIAVNRPKAKDADKAEVDFIPIVVWGNIGENCGKYLTKGSKVGVSGRLQIRDYEAQDGSKRRIAEVVAQNVEFLTPKNATGGQASVPPDDDDIPF